MFGKLGALITIGALAATLALAMAVVARAGAPVITNDNDTTPQAIDEWGDCSTFQINATFMARRRNEDFFDAAGNLVLERRHVNFSGALYNASDPTHAATYEGHFTRTLNPVSGTLTITGLMGNVILPGGRIIPLGAGSLTIDFATGDVLSHGRSADLTALCSALS